MVAEPAVAISVFRSYRGRTVTGMPLLCRLGFHRLVTVVGNYPGTTRWFKRMRCVRCGREGWEAR